VNSRAERILAILLVVLTFAAYWRVLGNGFVNFDDPDYIVDNHNIRHGINVRSIGWAFKTTLGSNWHPVTWLSHMLDYKIFGLRAWGHHFTSLLLHIINTFLLFIVLRRVTGAAFKSFVVAGLFGVHPLHVESVAWGAERKDVLSTLFWMLTMLAYVIYAGLDQRNSRGKFAAYLCVIGSLALGLMSKPMLVSLPFILLLLDYWPLGRFGVRLPSVGGEPLSGNRFLLIRQAKHLVVEKLPLFALSAASSVVTYLVQERTGAVSPLEYCPLGPRVANAAVSYIGYLFKAICPTHLAVFYPHPGLTLPLWQVIGAGATLGLLTIAVLWVARTKPYLAVGWFWYVITMVPVIGLVQVGAQAMADRYTYIPLIGVFIAAAWSLPEVSTGNKQEGIFPSSSACLLGVSGISWFVATIVLLAFAVMTWIQVGYWRNSITLFSHAIAVTQRNDVAHYNLGVALAKLNRENKAVRHFSAAVRINPNNADAQYNLGCSLAKLGRLDEAELAFREAIRLSPQDADAHNNFANLLLQQGKLNEAEMEYRRAISLNPEDPHLRQNLVALLLKKGKIKEAVGQLAPALESNRDDPYAAFNLASLLAEQKRYAEAIPHLRRAIRLKPDYAEAHYNLGVMLQNIGNMGEALVEYQEAVRLKPKFAQPHNNIAIILFMRGDYTGAWRELRLYEELGGKPHPDFVRALLSKMQKPSR